MTVNGRNPDRMNVLCYMYMYMCFRMFICYIFYIHAKVKGLIKQEGRKPALIDVSEMRIFVLDEADEMVNEAQHWDDTVRIKKILTEKSELGKKGTVHMYAHTLIYTYLNTHIHTCTYTHTHRQATNSFVLGYISSKR